MITISAYGGLSFSFPFVSVLFSFFSFCLLSVWLSLRFVIFVTDMPSIINVFFTNHTFLMCLCLCLQHLEWSINTLHSSFYQISTICRTSYLLSTTVKLSNIKISTPKTIPNSLLIFIVVLQQPCFVNLVIYFYYYSTHTNLVKNPTGIMYVAFLLFWSITLWAFEVLVNKIIRLDN